MTVSKKLQLLKLGYLNGNISRSFELADEIILESSNDDEIGSAWVYKALSAARMSNTSKERLTEAISYLEEAKECIPNSESLLIGTIELSGISLEYFLGLKEYYSDFVDQKVESQRGKVAHYRNESGSEYAGRELGQAFANSLYRGERVRKASVEAGKHFEQVCSSSLVKVFNYTFAQTSGNSEVVANIVKIIEEVINTTVIMPKARRKFRADIAPLVEKIWEKHSGTPIYYLKEPENLSCPFCGYEIIESPKPKRGLIGGLLLGTSDIVKSAKKGQKLRCVTCKYEWIRQ